MPRVPLLLLLATWMTACPTPAMPCRDDGDCAPGRSRCDRSGADESGEGTCVPRFLGPPVTGAERRTFGTGSSSPSEECGCGNQGDGCDEDGTCTCGAGAACGEGLFCVSGRCECTPQSCASGCCSDDNKCRDGTERNACGPAGGTCERCGRDMECADRRCVNER